MSKFKPTRAVVNNYKRGLKNYEEGLGGDGLEQGTVQKARDIVAGESVSEQWVRKANRFWARNERFLKEDEDSPAYVSALLWGGAAGRDWYRSVIKSIEGNMAKRKLIQCSTLVNKNAVRRETIDGVEHIIVESFTLPDNIVMNGGLYPKDEVDASFHTLEDTLAPIEHPSDENGMFISAFSPQAIHNFHAGAYNRNVEKVNGRVRMEKVINVQEAMKSERGKRLLDRIDELENSDDPRPIHTSVGVFVEVEDHEDMQTNAMGQEYNWTARNMSFDHDAILLDSIGAAQPHQGVGLAVNAQGQEVEVEQTSLNEDQLTPVEAVENEPEIEVNALSLTALFEGLNAALQDIIGANCIWLQDVMQYEGEEITELEDGKTVFVADGKYYEVPYKVDTNSGTPKIVGLPVQVEQQVTYTPKTNSEKGDAMKELILNALKEAGIEVEGKTDDQLFAEYNQLQANTSDSSESDSGDNAAIAELMSEVKSLKEQLTANASVEKDGLIEVIVNSGKYDGLDKDDLGAMGIDKLKSLAANCQESFGISPAFQANSGAASTVPTDMPE